MTATRRLAAILAADVVGYSRQMGADEAGTMARLRAVRSEVIEPLLAEHRGRLFKTTGDGFLAEFASAVQAVTCARAIQERMAGRNASATESERSELRIGLHTGDVLVEGDDLFGDGVNIAARLEGLAEPGGICISARVREDIAGKITIDVEDLGAPELKNIAQPVRVFRVRDGVAEQPTLALPDKPSIAVLPFANLSGDAEQEYFADGMAEEIITTLSRIRGFTVIARNSSFTYKGRAVDARQVGRELGARFVVEGSVRKGGSRVRIAAQLADATTGTQLWADRFDGALDDVFDLQDRVAASLIGAIEPRILAVEIARAQRKPPDGLHAYDLRLRALPLLYTNSRDSLIQAIDLLRQAIAAEPGYGLALATLARCRWSQVSSGHLDDNAPAIAEARRLANAALRLGRDDPEVLSEAGWFLAVGGGDRAGGLALIEEALALNPNSIPALRHLGGLRAYAGEVEAARICAARVVQLDPFGNRYFTSLFVAMAHFAAGDYAAAAEAAAESLRENEHVTSTLRYLAASLGLLGRLDEGRAAVARIRAIVPQFSIARARAHLLEDMNNPFGRIEVVDAFCEGLRRAGTPEA